MEDPELTLPSPWSWKGFGKPAGTRSRRIPGRDQRIKRFKGPMAPEWKKKEEVARQPMLKEVGKIILRSRRKRCPWKKRRIIRECSY